MLKLKTRNFIGSLTLLSGALSQYKVILNRQENSIKFIAASSPENRRNVVGAILDLQLNCDRHGLKTSEKMAQSAFDICNVRLGIDHWHVSNNLQTVVIAIEGLIHATMLEIEDRQFYVLDANVDADYDDAEKLFGSDVADAFQNAAFDISEAGKCLSFGLWTACVMHTMRVIENGLEALARHVGVTMSDNWNKTLNEIEAALRSIKKSSDGPDAEQTAAEAGTHLRFIKNAWRNQSMHKISKYDEREAKAIFENARSFMEHIAKMTDPNR